LKQPSLLALTLTAVVAIAIAGCGDPKKAPSIAAAGNEAPTMKPDRVAVTRVGQTVLGELSHIERAIKPFLGLELPGAPAEVASSLASGDCKKTQTTNAAQWETRWACGLDSTERGRKEIEGVERLNYDQSKRTLIYAASFTIRNFEDKEARVNAHTLITGRKIRITFAAGSSSVSGVAKIRIASSAALKTFDTARKGSNWSSSIGGILRRKGDTWTIDKGAVVALKGSLYGLDGERKTPFASGDFNFVSETDTALEGLGNTDCTKAIGTWRVSSTGGGAKFDTTLASTSTTVSESSGGSLPWPVDLCSQP
jgi:hypothetical protein